MSKLLTNFPKPSFEDWKAQLIKDLKGEPMSLLEDNNSIEEIIITSFQHQETTNQLPDIRFLKNGNNSWLNFGAILVNDIKSANIEALKLLELGADALRFEFNSSTIDFKQLLDGIQFQFIHTRFVLQTKEQLSAFQDYFSTEEQIHFSLELDAIQYSIWKETLLENNSISMPSFCVNGYAIQQRGANASQEIAFCLSTAHEYLVQLLEQGKTTEEANHLIHFNSGVGNNYFYEIAKINALRQLWNSILGNYNENHDFSQTVQITGIVGFVNKSIKDPYTNLLRQTTEAMSLLSAGIDGIIVLPYDSFSTNGTNELSQRMSLNIATILKEESYFHAVQQPTEGSYTVKTLQHLLATKSWELFQELESLGGMFDVKSQTKIKHLIEGKAQQRISLMKDKSSQFIGINIFPNPEEVNNNWGKLPSYLGMEQLILEQHQ